MPLLDIFRKEKQQTQETNRPVITADIHEKNSLVISYLAHIGIDSEMKKLPVADFLVKGIAIERKTVSDFLNSMISKRLIRQLKEMKQYKEYFLIIEGIEEHELYNDDKTSEKGWEINNPIKREGGLGFYGISKNGGGINPNAIRGFLLDIILKYKVPIIFTKDYKDTAKFLKVLVQKKPIAHQSLREVTKRAKNNKEQLEIILEGFPNIGPATAKKLLKEFGNLRNIITASDTHLEQLIGKKSESIIKFRDENY